MHDGIVGTQGYRGARMAEASAPVPSVDPDDGGDTPATPRPLGRSVGVGVAVGVGAALTTFFLVAIPIYTVASFESNGLDRPIIRTLLFRVALPVGAVIGMVVGLATARWMRRGGRWELGDGGDRYTTR